MHRRRAHTRIGVTGEPANDATHLNSPSGILFTREGNNIVADGFTCIADHAGERVHKIALDDGRILAAWGEPGRGPGQFDWVHGMAVDTQGAVYAADTYGQRVQKVRAGGSVV